MPGQLNTYAWVVWGRADPLQAQGDQGWCWALPRGAAGCPPQCPSALPPALAGSTAWLDPEYNNSAMNWNTNE